jgi:hypothetical protein
MSLVRRRLSWLITGWLACQFAGYVAAPFALCCEDASATALPKCCQGVAPGQTCPMHHRHGGDEDSTCKMRNACARGDSALVSLGSGLGILAPPTIDVTAFAVRDRLTASLSPTILRTDRPESPPPRA